MTSTPIPEVKRRPFHRLVYFSVPAAFLISLWLPVRVVFFSRPSFRDGLVEAVVLLLVVVRLALRESIVTDRRNLKTKSSFLKYVSLTADIVTAVPWVTILSPLIGPAARLFFLLKLLYARRILDIRRILDSHDSLHPAITRLLPMALILPVMVHLIACGWVWLGSGTAPAGATPVVDYCRAVYWTITTLCTVGYGDISARTVPQMFYANLTMTMGVAFFGYILSNMASLIARLDATRDEYLSQLDRVDGFMRYNGLSARLRTKVRAYYRYLWDSRSGYDDSSVLSALPTKLRVEVSIEMNAEMIEKVPVLKGASQDLLEEIVLELKPAIVVPEEVIFRAGAPGDAMYFIHRGAVDILSREGDVVATLEAGAFFGEMALLASQPRNASARAVDYCELFVLSREVFLAVLKRHPDFEKHVRDIASSRTSGRN